MEQCGVEERSACVGVEENASSCFRVNDDLRQGCEMCPWLFKIYVDVVVRKGYESTRGKRVQMIDWHQRERLFS